MLKNLIEYIRAGDWAEAWREIRNTLHLAICWNYRCVQAWEIHYPPKGGYPARVVEVDPQDNESVLYCIRCYLRPGERVRLYIRYVSGKRKRIRLR